MISMTYTRRVAVPYPTLYGVPVVFSPLFKGSGIGLLKFSSGKVKLINKRHNYPFYIEPLCRDSSEDFVREIIIDEVWYRSRLKKGEFNAHYIGSWGPD